MKTRKKRINGHRIGILSLMFVAGLAVMTVAVSGLPTRAASPSDFKGMLISPATQRLSLKNGLSYTRLDERQ